MEMPGDIAATLVQAVRRDWHDRGDPKLSPFVAALSEALDGGLTVPAAASGAAPPAGFDAALAAMTASAPLGDALRALLPAVTWKPLLGRHPDVPETLSEGLHVALLLAGLGLVSAVGPERIRMGLFHLAPGVHYPLHSHEATEVYHCLAGSLRLQHGLSGKPFTLSPGAHSVTPSERVHSLTTSEAPVLLLFAWTEPFQAPIYWWERDGEAPWHRVRWIRDSQNVWARQEAEPVSPALLAEQA
ncbi:MAG: hypothetical protein Kilf2KO_44110 [Rhodospirillales bacterium]